MTSPLHQNRLLANVAAAAVWCAALLLVSGCGDGGADLRATSTLSGGSCHSAATGMCLEYPGAAWKGLTMERLCNSQKNAYAAGPCPSEAKVGTCLQSKGTKTESRRIYYTTFPGYGVKLTAAAVAATGQEQCVTATKGEWRAP